MLGLVPHLGLNADHGARRKTLRKSLTGFGIDPFRLDFHDLRASHDARQQVRELAGIIDIAMQMFGDIAFIEDALLARNRVQNDLRPALYPARIFAPRFLVQCEPFKPGLAPFGLPLALNVFAGNPDM